jgi:hypothetical protein
MNDRTSTMPEPPGDPPRFVERARKISDRLDKTTNLISAEWLLSSLGLSNGGSVIVVRALFVALWVLILYPAHPLTPAAVVFGFVYTALYTRFAVQWRYLADVYNKIKEAEVKYSTQNVTEERFAEWKAGFAKDAEDLHLATKKMFAPVISTWLASADVRTEFLKYTAGDEHRYENLLQNADDVRWRIFGVAGRSAGAGQALCAGTVAL